ncbi:hypothetical protein [Aphanizomenon flos-aquae]|jgi:hypothetical protein|uniref:CopG n=1 Tax=Aphanizomenon flos-aquae FACHB-1040 TaxID=2692887 RepID=A0ABR8BYS1_APHFL|nr:hypothetical protein [Aphanizomenon flos-aquae]MBD2280063.1 hypothetical protein [Aphanizomenon flos-aquae FACHB-1040]
MDESRKGETYKIVVYLNKQDYELVRLLAKEQGIALSELGNNLFQEYIDRTI